MKKKGTEIFMIDVATSQEVSKGKREQATSAGANYWARWNEWPSPVVHYRQNYFFTTTNKPWGGHAGEKSNTCMSLLTDLLSFVL